MLELLNELESLCPKVILRGKRIVRMTEKIVGIFQLDPQTFFELGTTSIGVLIGGAESNDLFMECLREVSAMDLDGTVVVVTSSKKLADGFYTKLMRPGTSKRRPDVFEMGSVILSTPEKLHKISPNDRKTRPVLGIILLDPYCVVHQARGDEGYGWVTNDRPRHLVKFRYEHRRGEWQPPMLLMTTKPVKSLNTNQMLAPYSLEAWWYVDAATLKCCQ